MHGDNCASVAVGHVDPEGLRLMDAAQQALDAGVAACRPGGCLSTVGAAIHDVADALGYETVRAYSGHGVGPDLHMRPYVYHYRCVGRGVGYPYRSGDGWRASFLCSIRPSVPTPAHAGTTRRSPCGPA